MQCSQGGSWEGLAAALVRYSDIQCAIKEKFIWFASQLLNHFTIYTSRIISTTQIKNDWKVWWLMQLPLSYSQPRLQQLSSRLIELDFRHWLIFAIRSQKHHQLRSCIVAGCSLDILDSTFSRYSSSKVDISSSNTKSTSRKRIWSLGTEIKY